MTNPQRRAYLKEYRAKHGHHPEDIKARIGCNECQVTNLVGHTIISIQGSIEPDKYSKFIDSTSYCADVKSLAKAKLKDIIQTP